MTLGLPSTHLKAMCLTAISLGTLITSNPTEAQQPYLGTCDPSMGRSRYFRYECQRGDGSIGYMPGGRAGDGSPIMSIHRRNTSSAYMLTKTTSAFPGYFCYYNEPDLLMNPSEKCKADVKQAIQELPKKISADCTTGIATFFVGSPESFTYKFPTGWLAGGTDIMVSIAFRILCPVAFAKSGVEIPY